MSSTDTSAWSPVAQQAPMPATVQAALQGGAGPAPAPNAGPPAPFGFSPMPNGGPSAAPPPPTDPTADINAYANLPDNLQAGGRNFVPSPPPPAPTPYRSPITRHLDRILGVPEDVTPGVSTPSLPSNLPALMGAPTQANPGGGSMSFNPRDPQGALASIIAQAGADQSQPLGPGPTPPPLMGAPGAPVGLGPVGGLPGAPPQPYKPSFFETLASGGRTMSWADAQDNAIARHNAMAGGGPPAPNLGPQGGVGSVAYQPSYQDMLAFKTPQGTWGDAREGAMKAYYDQIGQQVGMQNLMAVGRALSGGGGVGSASGPGGQGGPAGGGPAAPYGPLAGPGIRSALAMSAYARGQAKDAADILSDKVVIGPDGQPLDEKTGQPVGPRMANHQIVNGYNVDIGAPNAPGFIPKLADGTMPDGKGGVIPIPGVVAAAAAQARATADATNASEAGYAGRKAFGTAAGTGAGSAMTDVITVPDGKGGSVQMTRAQYLSGLGKGGGPAAAGPAGTPAGSGGLGFTPSKADQDFDSAQATDASKTLGSDLDARPDALQARDSARQALAYVQAHKMDRLSPHLAAGAQYLRSLPAGTLQSLGVNPKDIDRAANDPAVYQRLSSQNLLSFSKSNLPSRYTEREMAVAGKVIPGLSTPNDAAAMHWGLQAAIANKTLQRAQFAAGYQGPRSRQGIEQSWMSQPAGQAGLFEDPVWKNVSLGGKPAVIYTRKNGKLYGIVGAGTGSPTSFLASGQ